MKVNRNVAPYYDDYDSTKQYTQLLAIPGRVAQAREITQLQSVVKDIIKGVGDSVMKNGDIIEGCQVIINNEKTEATITAGRVYLDGIVLPVPETKIGIKGVGTETIGFKLYETLITEEEDNTLRDPAQGYDNYNQPGCHRIKSTVVIVKDEEDSAILVTLIDGAVSVEKYAPNYDVLTQTLARRTYDESGSYIVEGLNVRIEDYRADASKFTVVIESGKAYILGYELKIPAARRLVLPRATTYSPVTGVLLAYDPSLSNYVLSNAPYVRDITSVKGSVQKVVSQSISSNTDRVLIDEVEGIQIVSVKQGDVEYTVGTATTGDCYLQREGTRYYLAWNGTDNYPTLNASYSVTYNYTYTFTEGTDYALEHNTVTDSHELVWLEGGTTPLANTNFTVDYNQYLARKDIIYINQYGDIDAVIGTPAEYGFEVASDAPVNTLPLASISSPPGGLITENENTRIHVSNIGLTRFTMNDIQGLLNRIRTLEYDQSVLSLNEEAKQYETTTSKRGIFTDPLIDFSKLDYYYNLLNGVAIDPDRPIYDATLELKSSICYLPTIAYTYDPDYNATTSTVAKHGRTVTLAKIDESVVMSQMNATKTFLVNPYSMFPQLPEISITPAVDTWIDDSIITIPVSQNTTEVISSSTRHVNMNVSSGTSSGTILGRTSSDEFTTIGVRSQTIISESVVSEQSITYIRPRTITVEGSLFPPNLNDIKCYFDGVLTPLTPIEGTEAGADPGSVKSNALGEFKAEFTIPDKILTGIREVRLESDVQIEGFINSAFALYQASGTKRTIQRTVTALTTVLMNRVTTITTRTSIDPVGQTFVLDRMTMISGIDLYFEGKPTSNTPVSCEIREVVNGNITSTVYGHKSLPANSVNVSSDSTVATRFTFDDPVLLEENKEYAFVVRSTSALYRIWVANLGENDILTGDPVLSNPYLIGVMMSSSNNSSWTTHQTTDIKFRLIEDVYSDSSEVVFDELKDIEDFSKIYFFADSVVPDGTSVDWFYSTDSGVSYKSIAPYNTTVLDYLRDSIIFKARLTKLPTSNLSPVIAVDTVGAELSRYETEGCYITRNITGLDPYTNVDVVLDTYTPSGTSLEVLVDNGDGNLVKATLDPDSVRTLNYGWREQTFKVTVPGSTQCRVFIKMHSAYEYFTPSFRKVRVIMS